MGPTVFRDGIFSQADPLQPGGYQHAYSDGSLGANPLMRKSWPGMRKTRRRRAPGPMRVVRRRAVRGVGMTASTKGALITVGVLVLALVAMPIIGSRKR